MWQPTKLQNLNNNLCLFLLELTLPLIPSDLLADFGRRLLKLGKSLFSVLAIQNGHVYVERQRLEMVHVPLHRFVVVTDEGKNNTYWSYIAMNDAVRRGWKQMNYMANG